MTDQFGAPAAPTKRTGPNGIELDRWGRYLLPHPVTGVEQPWTRASTLSRTIEDTYHLALWQQRTVARGMSLEPHLVALMSSLDEIDGDDKAQANDIAARALERAGGTSRRDTGTALHAFTARWDARQSTGVCPPHLTADVKAYSDLLVQEGLEIHPTHVERTVCVPEWGIAGTLDRLARCRDGRYRIVDVKTGARADEFGALGFVVQQTAYARGALWGLWDPITKTWCQLEPAILENLDLSVALVLHLPAGRARGSLHAVNLEAGVRYAELALAVRAARKDSNLMAPVSFALPADSTPAGPAPSRPAAQLAIDTTTSQLPARDPVRILGWLTEQLVTQRVPGTTLDENVRPAILWLAGNALDAVMLAQLWELAHPRGLWTDEVATAATVRHAELIAGGAA